MAKRGAFLIVSLFLILVPFAMGFTYSSDGYNITGSRVQGCEDECTEGEKVCRDGSMYVCGYFDDDRCVEWYIEDCPPRHACDEGKCVALACIEDWVCGEWRECIDGRQSRTCSDWNECGTMYYTPDLAAPCEETEEGKEEAVIEAPAPVNINAISQAAALIAILLAVAVYLILEYRAWLAKEAGIVVKKVRNASAKKKPGKGAGKRKGKAGKKAKRRKG